MGTIFKKIFSLLFFLQAFTSQSFLFPQVSAKDQVTDTVKCRDKIGQSYALYRPAQYDNKKSWPVILIFDPSAKGRTGVNTFIEAGRKYGFILACSNNSCNGPLGDNFTAAAAMLQDIEKRFTVDQRRIYAAGFSGGSRFAMAFAVKEKRISGVIGCGAGLPNDRNYLPSANSGFLYYGLAGTRDMNYLEMHDLPGFFSNQTRVISYYRNRLYAQAAFLFEICILSDSENHNNYYNLARFPAGSAKSKESVDALYAAMNHGFNSRKTVESDPAFGKIRDDTRYKALIIKMK